MPEPDGARSRRLNLAIGGGVAVLLAAALVLTMRPEPRLGARQPDAPPVFDAEWTQLPTPQDVQRVYPAGPRADRFTQRVVVEMRCVITDSGGLSECAIYHESISGLGFGEAALALADRFTLKTHAPDGSSLVGLPVTVPMGFNPIFADPEPRPRSRTAREAIS